MQCNGHVPTAASPGSLPHSQALAEKLHELVRREVWGYAADESMSVDDMLKVGGKGRTDWERWEGEEPALLFGAAPVQTRIPVALLF